MEWLNYHHLLYFWTVARKGSVVEACRELRLRQPTVSAQIRALEDSLGEQLFARKGRKLELTEVGSVVFRYADQIFGLGRELVDVLKGRATGKLPELAVGIANVVPKLIAYRLLRPALRMPNRVAIQCREDSTEKLLADLAIHNLDVVLSDEPLPAGVNVKAYNHLLGECGISVVGKPSLGGKYKRGFPHSLSGAPLLLPARGTALRRALDQYFDERDIRPLVIGEFDDSALLKIFGQAGEGLFVVPNAVEGEARRQYEVEAVGRINEVREKYYMISLARKIANPALAKLVEVAREQIFRDL